MKVSILYPLHPGSVLRGSGKKPETYDIVLPMLYRWVDRTKRLINVLPEDQEWVGGEFILVSAAEQQKDG